MEAEELSTNGYCVLKSVFDAPEIAGFRAAISSQTDKMGQTRRAGHSYHLAGFHRFNSFASCHAAIQENEKINEFLSSYFKKNAFYAIGLSDITINRSQQWHTDLLRGKYTSYLQQDRLWNPSISGCIKALVYLQSGKSLRIVPKSHLQPTPLDDAQLDTLAQTKTIEQLIVNAGDVVMMDIRSLHRGSTDEEMSTPELANNPKILISTVFGEVGSSFARAMELGNVARMQEWDQKYLSQLYTLANFRFEIV